MDLWIISIPLFFEVLVFFFFCPFACLLNIKYKSSLEILDTGPWPDKCFAHIFPQSVAGVLIHSLNCIFWSTRLKF